jgi:hypothetical protein
MKICTIFQVRLCTQGKGTQSLLFRQEGVLAVKIMPDFGTLRENEAAFDVAVACITSGDSEWGRSILATLRDHIYSTGEQKSVQWILPQVLEILEARKSCPPIPPSHIREEGIRMTQSVLCTAV